MKIYEFGIGVTLALVVVACFHALYPSTSLHGNFMHNTLSARPGTRVLVTGGSGFIGSNLVDMLLSLEYKVRVFDNLVTGDIGFLDLSHPNLEFVYGDIANVTEVRSAMQGMEYVFHLAAMSKVAPSLSDPKMATFCVQVNSVGTSIVLQEAVSAKVKKVVYAASSTFYGDNRKLPYHEDFPFHPSSPYATSKYEGELLMSTFEKVFGIHTLSLRFFMVYGPRQPSAGAYAIVTGKFALQKAQGKPLTIEGSGSQFRDFIHVKDIARALILGSQSSVHGTVINVGSGQKTSVKEVADLISSSQVHLPARPHDLPGTLADTSRAESLLGFRSQFEFKESMTKLLQAPERSLFAACWPDAAMQLTREARNQRAAESFQTTGAVKCV